MKLLIIIPAYNESENIGRVVDELIVHYSQYDYLIINDGSKDDTATICRAREYKMLDLPVNLGLSGVFQCGIRYAYLKNYDTVVQFDGDGQHDPRYIDAMLKEMLENNVDIVIASRFKDRCKPMTLRMLGSRMIQYAIKITTGRTINDPTSGMRLYSKKMLKLFADDINFAPEPDTLAYLVRCGHTVSEIQAEMKDRIAGNSYLTTWRSLLYMVHMMLSIFAIQFVRRRGR